jgi:DNA-damage-inducible protein D
LDQLRPLLVNQLEACKRVSPNGVAYWMGRDLQPLLGYTSWENFANVIEKAKMACESAGVDAGDQFHEVTKGIAAGKGAEVQRNDIFLSRYACYLIAMNGDPRKAEVGLAQTYFAVQTRRQEIRDQNPELRRVEMRQRVKEANRSLTSAAKDAGVQNYGLFHDAGYRGLYGMGVKEIKSRKGISPKDDLLDRAGRVELAANEFRITQAEDKLRREKVNGESHAIHTHRQVGEAVRATIRQLGGVVPENLPAEPSIKKLVSAKKPKRLAGSEKALPSPSGLAQPGVASAEGRATE